MYRIRVVQKNGYVTEGFLNMSRTLDRFYALVAEKAKFALDINIYLEELVHAEPKEYKVHKIG